MSTVKIKTEPTAAATAAVDVQVKLEPSFSTNVIKLEQHSSDIDTKVESDTEADSEEADIKSENDDDDDDDEATDQATEAPGNQRQYICEHPGCDRSFNFANILKLHQHEHRVQTELNINGNKFILTRESLNGRWPCPVPNCKITFITANSASGHLRVYHDSNVKEKQTRQSLSRKTRNNLYFHDVENIDVNGVRCGYYATIGVFICHECRLVPECLLTHLQQRHSFDEKAIDNSVLPESAVTANVDPNINQHTNNPHLASAISQPYQQQHQNIVRGWLCVISDCGYCGYTDSNKSAHKKYAHQGERLTIVPALVLRLVYARSNSCYFFIARLDQAIGAVTTSSNRVNQRKLDYSHNGLNSQNESEDDASQNETADASNPKRQWTCKYPNCERVFNLSDQLCKHRREHKLEVVTNVRGNIYTLVRQSSDDRWACPVPECETTWKSVNVTRDHIMNIHSTSLKHKRANSEDGSDIQQQPSVKRKQYTIHYLNVDYFYTGDTRCGYNNLVGVFIWHECRLVPECLLSHLQQTHGYDEKSIDSAILPESVRVTGSDPNINQHASNPHLAAAIREPNQPQHPDIVRGWLCVTSDCGYCGYTAFNKKDHKKKMHKGEQIMTVPALVLRLPYAKTQTSYFLITRLDTTNRISSSNECDEDNGDELVPSDYGSDEDDIH